MSFETLVGLWREGYRRLERTDPAIRPALERVVAALVDELRRRLGGPFTADELAELYLDAGHRLVLSASPPRWRPTPPRPGT